jgi:hypothetical protein
VLVEYRAEDPDGSHQAASQDDRSPGDREMQAVGLKHVETKKMLPQQHLMIFQKSAR